MRVKSGWCVERAVARVELEQRLPSEGVAVVLVGVRLGHAETRVGPNLGLGFEFERDWEVESENGG